MVFCIQTSILFKLILSLSSARLMNLRQVDSLACSIHCCPFPPPSFFLSFFLSPSKHLYTVKICVYTHIYDCIGMEGKRNGRSSWEWQGIVAFCTCQWSEWMTYISNKSHVQIKVPQLWQILTNRLLKTRFNKHLTYIRPNTLQLDLNFRTVCSLYLHICDTSCCHWNASYMQ